MIERPQESAFSQLASLILLVSLLLVIAPFGFLWALVHSRGFWWFCAGAIIAAIILIVR